MSMDKRGLLTRNPFPAVLKEKFVSLRDPAVQTSAATPARMISIIIPAHNEERYIEKTLEALSRQEYGWFEVIVVANGCTDKTVNVARGRCHRLIVLPQKTLGVARNLGAKMAKSELLLFLDADTLLDPQALKTIAQEFSQEYSAGTLKGQPDCSRLAYRILYGLKNFVHWSGLHGGSSGVIVCWKKDFIRAGGFDEGLEVRENSHLIRRLLRFGRYHFNSRVSATTSMRRYDRQGCVRMFWMWFKLWFHSWFGDLHARRYETVR